MTPAALIGGLALSTVEVRLCTSRGPRAAVARSRSPEVQGARLGVGFDRDECHRRRGVVHLVDGVPYPPPGFLPIRAAREVQHRHLHDPMMHPRPADRNRLTPTAVRHRLGRQPHRADRQGDLTTALASNTFDDMAVNLDESRHLVDAGTHSDPEIGLAAVVALRQLVEVLEALQVDNARAKGWSWRDIGRRLGLTKQAVHYKHGLRVRDREQS
jgi:hypothetical protein